MCIVIDNCVWAEVFNVKSAQHEAYKAVKNG